MTPLRPSLPPALPETGMEAMARAERMKNWKPQAPHVSRFKRGCMAHTKTSGTTQACLFILCEFTNRAGEAHPPATMLARFLNVSEKQARRCLQQLVKSGDIAVVTAGRQGSRKAAKYRITHPQLSLRAAITAKYAQEPVKKPRRIRKLIHFPIAHRRPSEITAS